MARSALANKFTIVLAQGADSSEVAGNAKGVILLLLAVLVMIGVLIWWLRR